MNYLGIDIGTSGCKSVIFNQDGVQQSIAHREYSVKFTGEGGAQLNSEEVMDKCFETIRECASQVESKSVKGLSISSQGEAFTAIGKHGEILFDAMVSSDGRAAKYVNEWIKTFGIEHLYRTTGHTAHSIFTLFKLLWLKENHPDVWSKTRYFLCFEDLLIYRLGFKPVISYSLAGRTMLFDIINQEWDSGILDHLSIAEEQLATPMPSGSRIGAIPGRIAATLGLANDVIVVTGGHDQGCAALGAGVTDTSSAMLGSGSVECITAVTDAPVFSNTLRKNNLCTYHYTVDGYFSTLAYSLTGGNLLQWFKNEFGTQEMLAAQNTQENVYDLLLKKIENGPSDLLALPYLTPSGTPHFDAQTKGAILGLRLSTSRTEILKALLEGIAFEIRLNLDILRKSGYQITELRNVGGGSKSPAWIQLKADVMDMEITTLTVNEAGCCGAAMLAYSAITSIPVWEVARKWIKPGDIFTPSGEYQQYYNEKFESYCLAYESIKGLNI